MGWPGDCGLLAEVVTGSGAYCDPSRIRVRGLP